jgi:hypothetical protein
MVSLPLLGDRQMQLTLPPCIVYQLVIDLVKQKDLNSVWIGMRFLIVGFGVD